MAFLDFPKAKKSFRCFENICPDVLKQPLVDILASEIQPADLYNKIRHCNSFKSGELCATQRKICFCSPPAIPDYNNFDVTMLYTLIRNLCPSLKPTKGWGKDPVDADIQIGDDIERLRLLRNNIIHHGSSETSFFDFEIILMKLKSIIKRIQNYMSSKGYKVNYEEKITNIKYPDIVDELMHMATMDSLKQAEHSGKRRISIKGQGSVLCGNSAKFYVDITPENLKGCSITWEKIEQLRVRRINLSTKKYSGSTDKNLVVQSVCKEDEGKYIAILSMDLQYPELSIKSNAIVLQAYGELPIFDVWNVTTEMKEIRIHYGVRKMLPFVNEIKWIKDGVTLLNSNKKCYGGKLNDSYFAITSPTIEDRGNYSCVVKNAVGSVKKDVQFDIPDVIMEEPKIKEDGTHLIRVRIKSIPAPYFVQWKEKHGDEYIPINVKQKKYQGTSNSLTHPVLIVSQLDKLKEYLFQIEVCNLIGSSKETKKIDVASEKNPTEQELASVSKHIGADFLILGVQLGLTNTTIAHIIDTYKCAQTQIYNILLSWKNKDGDQATIRKLLEVMKDYSSTCTVDMLEIERIFQCDKNDGSTNH